VIGIDPETNYDVDRLVEYQENLDLGMLLDESLQRNSNYLISRAQLTQSELDIRLAKSNYFPTLDLQAGYNYSNQAFDANFLETNRTNGWNTGVSLSFNIFNGGQTRRAEQNARIQMESSQVRIDQTQNQLKTDILTSFNNYETNKDLLALNIRNLELAEANYSRSQEAFSTGEITGLQLREAQLNLLSSRFAVSQLRVQTKASELNLYYLAGILVDRAP
jgi:outer membrane protein TolC